jgi:outer membrane murein-binding lipoprotein Lpp
MTSKKSVEGLAMRSVCWVLFVTVCSLTAAGCGNARIKELAAEVDRLKAAGAVLEAKNTALQAELTQAKQEAAQAQQQLVQIEEIKKGYEDARVKFGDSLKQVAPLLGISGSPLPPFEGLKDSSWVGKFAPPANLAPDMKALQNELQGLMGEGFKLPKQ